MDRGFYDKELIERLEGKHKIKLAIPHKKDRSRQMTKYRGKLYKGICDVGILLYKESKIPNFKCYNLKKLAKITCLPAHYRHSTLKPLQFAPFHR
jgi:hypothetical protein